MKEIVKMDESNLEQAGWVHAEAWKESHRSFCLAEFVEKHTPAAQTEYLRREMKSGKKLFMLVDDGPVGIVSIQGDLIENLYVLPQRQNQGYGSVLLRFAMAQCGGDSVLWVLNTNEGARRLYRRNGFVETGERKQLNEQMYEIEMRKKQ